MIVYKGLVGVVNASNKQKKLLSSHVELCVGQFQEDVNVGHLKKNILRYLVKCQLFFF